MGARFVSKVKCIDGNDNNFVGLFFDDRDDLFDCVMFALPLALKRKIVAAHFTPSGRQLSGAFSHSLFYLGLSCAALSGLLFRVFGEPNAFHESPGRLREIASGGGPLPAGVIRVALA